MSVTVQKHIYNALQFIILFHQLNQVEQDKYEKGVEWVRELLYRTKFTADRLKIIAQRMANDVASDKRKGSKIARTVLGSMLYQRGKCLVLLLSVSVFLEKEFFKKCYDLLLHCMQRIFCKVHNISWE